MEKIKNNQMRLLSIRCYPRYFEDATVSKVNEYEIIDDENGDLIPCTIKETNEIAWCPIIDIDSGRILNWENGKSADIHYKVCDAGEYVIFENKNIYIRIWSYVPDFLSIGSQGYGDYIIFKVDVNGNIENWDPIRVDLDKFQLCDVKLNDIVFHIDRMKKFKRSKKLEKIFE